MAVELDLGLAVLVGEAEVVEEVGAAVRIGGPALAEGGAQVLDQRLGVDLLLEVDGRGLDDEVGPVGEVLAAPDELRVEVGVAALPGGADRVAVGVGEDGLELGRGDVGAAAAGG